MKSRNLVFDWPVRHRIHLLLPLMVVIAGLIHAAVFFLFAAKQPNPLEGGPNPAKVFFLGPGSASAIQLAPLLDSMDPALHAPGRGLAREIPIEASYTPQYLESSVDFDAPPRSNFMDTEDRVFLGPVEIRPAHYSNPVTRKPAPTRLFFSSSISNRVPPSTGAGKFRMRSSYTPAPASFLFGLSPEGRIVHLVIDRSSGDEALDIEAMRRLREINFLPIESQKTEWGFVEFQWGGDLESSPDAT